MMVLRKFAMIVAVVMGCFAASAATYTVDEMPNVHVANRNEFVANPDGILSPEAVGRMNASLQNLRQTTTVEPMVVVVDNIEPADIDVFATELFGKWGLGKSDMDNGLLVLVAKDLRRVAIRTGYGIEGALPDILCDRIIRKVIAPAFRKGDYDGGLVDAVTAISQILSNPEVAAEYASNEADKDNQRSSVDGFEVYLQLSKWLAVVMLLLFVGRLISLRGRSDYEKYCAFASWRPIMLMLSFIGLGMPLVATIPLILLLNHWRNHSRKCPNCSAKMMKVDEVNDNKFLTPSQDLEEQVGSVDYDVWICQKCNETDILAYVNSSSSMSECPNCHARTLVMKVNRVVSQPTAYRSGVGEKVYVCLNCHHTDRRQYKIDADDSGAAVAALGAAAILGGRGGRGFGGGSFGGGFGGGMTGGGGSSGSW